MLIERKYLMLNNTNNPNQRISLDDLDPTDIIIELNDRDAAKINGGRGHKSRENSPYGPNGEFFGFVGY
jgi:hypothetical protein